MNITASDFLSVFFDSDDDVNLRVFADKKPSDFKGKNYTVKLCDFHTLFPTLQEHNAKERGIFFVVNSGGQADSEINRINAQFVESDTLSIETQLEMVMSFPLEPSVIVKTQKSLHTYWLMSEASVTNFRTIQKKLALQFEGDKTCVNKSRVLRVPSFYHCKGEPVLVECVKFNPELKYTQAELEAALPDLPTEAPKSKATGTAFGLELVCDKCDFLRHCKDNAASLPEHDWYAMVTNLAVFSGGSDVIHDYSNSYPTYNRIETDRKIEHFLKSKTKPITCEVIAEKGFRCPKLGVCKCKSPAGLSFQPLDTGDISAVFEALTPSGNHLPTSPQLRRQSASFYITAIS